MSLHSHPKRRIAVRSMTTLTSRRERLARRQPSSADGTQVPRAPVPAGRRRRKERHDRPLTTPSNMAAFVGRIRLSSSNALLPSRAEDVAGIGPVCALV